LNVVTELIVGYALPGHPEALMFVKAFGYNINGQADSTWKAKLHPRFANMDNEQIKKFLGAKKRHENPRKRLFKIQPKSKPNVDIPKEFDARTQWPNCADVIGTIPDQSSCGSCWAVSSASVMSDRVCIGSDGNVKTPISSNDLISCCSSCGYGCEGGYPDETFYYWQSSGVVSGSGYTLDEGCQPYPFPVCEHHTTKTKYPACQKELYDTPKCQKKCQQSYTTNTYKNDKTYGKSSVFYSMDNDGVQQEIMKNGPVVFTFTVYEDFVTYSSGVYEHKKGKELGGHAVRAIGWGEENGTPYWLIVNSWNEDWGDQGYFKIVRGKDNCGIEEEISAALFKQ